MTPVVIAAWSLLIVAAIGALDINLNPGNSPDGIHYDATRYGLVAAAAAALLN